jgi:putative transposase
LLARPDRVWNRIADDVRERIRKLALKEPALSPRELAVRFTDPKAILCQKLRSTAC